MNQQAQAAVEANEDKPKAFGYSLPPTLAGRIRAVATAQERSDSFIVRKAVESYLPQFESVSDSPTQTVPNSGNGHNNSHTTGGKDGT